MASLESHEKRLNTCIIITYEKYKNFKNWNVKLHYHAEENLIIFSRMCVCVCEYRGKGGLLFKMINFNIISYKFPRPFQNIPNFTGWTGVPDKGCPSLQVYCVNLYLTQLFKFDFGIFFLRTIVNHISKYSLNP